MLFPRSMSCMLLRSTCRKTGYGDACRIQKGEQHPIRKGTTKQLQAGARKMRTLAKHNIRPKFVQRVLKQETARKAEVCTAQAQKKPTVATTHLIEYCCGNKSLLMKNWERQGGKGTRVSLPQMNAEDPKIVQRIVDIAKKEIKQGRLVRMHVALPCKH